MEKALSDSKNANGPVNAPLSVLSLSGLLFSTFCWGLSFPLLTVALKEIEPITLAVIRYTIAVIPVIIYMLVTRGSASLIRPIKDDFLFFICLALVGITLPNIFQNFGMTMTPAHLSSIIQASGPVFTIMLAVIFLKEPLVKNKIIGTGIAILGTFFLVTGDGLELGDSMFIGNMLVLLSAVSYSFSSIMNKSILKKYDPFTLAAVTMLLGTIILAFFLVFESPVQKIPKISFNGWIIVLVLALLPGAAALLVWFKVMQSTEVSKIIIFVYLIPVFAAAISYFWPGESIKLTTILFAGLIVVGVAIAQLEKKGVILRIRM